MFSSPPRLAIIHKFLLPAGEKARMRGKSSETEHLVPPHLDPLPEGERKRVTDDNLRLMYNDKPCGERKLRVMCGAGF
ncbi:MAG: hypothetical protein A2219_07925 [Elusimicrobia bacterium RIFOXYA2_FULL_50_26]|nr:MAG: hypothetical protein A2219_07925 [Elusimicrobia bacterium RIFOXYA2_FULL_50_26]OGS24812.1 MAG: hypothetical protein A2314_02055 [Elusimicrobia bacterium RIFOXYB2_FULL_50_12]